MREADWDELIARLAMVAPEVHRQLLGSVRPERRLELLAACAETCRVLLVDYSYKSIDAITAAALRAKGTLP